MFLQPLDLTTALRPSLLPDEVTLFVQNSIGLYEGKYKVPDFQNGHAYLTTHRICYVDNEEPRKHAGSIELKAIDRYDFYAGFLKSSAKIILYQKAPKRSSFEISQPRLGNAPATQQSPTRSSNTSSQRCGTSPLSTNGSGTISPHSSTATWVCSICSFSNPMPANFDHTTANTNTPLPLCSACGIQPSFSHLLKAAIASASGRQVSTHPSLAPDQLLLESNHQYTDVHQEDYNPKTLGAPLPAKSSFQCPRCTFLNHPSLLVCEICGASLFSKAFDILGDVDRRPESPGLFSRAAEASLDQDVECIKISFRNGGEKIFHERLKGAMVQRKWLLQSAPPIPEPVRRVQDEQYPRSVESRSGYSPPPMSRAQSAGIAGLERRGLEIRKKNEVVMGSAFEDLDALMASAKEIRALAESFATQAGGKYSDGSQLIADSSNTLNILTTKDMFGTKAGSDSLYLSEMSRNLAEYLTDDVKGILRKEGGIMSLVDLWAVFNRARGGVELISPTDFEKAARLWGKLKLPVRLRQFKNRLLVVQQADRTDDKTVAQLLSWLQELHSPTSSILVHHEWELFGHGITAQETAQRFGWSVGVATEELEMAEEQGALCREEGVEGVRFWENWLVDLKDSGEEDGINVHGIKRDDMEI